MELKHIQRKKRKLRIRSRISGSELQPRLSVYRSNKHIFAQLIDDVAGKTVVSSSDLSEKKGNKVEKAKTVGLKVAELAQKKKIKKIKFDRSGYKYHGRVKALADGAREGGLQF